MKVDDKIKIKIPHGYWKIGHKGEIKVIGFEAWRYGKVHKYDYGILLDGNGFYSGFDESELERME